MMTYCYLLQFQVSRETFCAGHPTGDTGDKQKPAGEKTYQY